MTRLRLGPIEDDKPVRLTIELPAAVHRDLGDYARLLARENDQGEVTVARLVPAMLARFMHGDRGFQRLRSARRQETNVSGPSSA